MATTLQVQMIQLNEQNGEYPDDVYITHIVVTGLTGGGTHTITDTAGETVFSRVSAAGEDIVQNMYGKHSKGLKITSDPVAGHAQVHTK